jgi:hypothetical protein
MKRKAIGLRPQLADSFGVDCFAIFVFREIARTHEGDICHTPRHATFLTTADVVFIIVVMGV